MSSFCFKYELFFFWAFQQITAGRGITYLPSLGTGCVSQKRYVWFLACCRVLGRLGPKEKRWSALWISCCFFSGRESSWDRTRPARTSYYVIFPKKIEAWLSHSLSPTVKTDHFSRHMYLCDMHPIHPLTQRHKPWQMGPWVPLVSRHLPSFASFCSFVDYHSRPLSASYH